MAQYRGKERYFEKENCSFGNRRICFFSALDESRRGFARAKRIRIGAASALLRGKARTVKENRGEKTKEHFDNEVLLEQKLFSSTQFHPTFNNLPVLKPIPKNRSLQFIYILLSKHFYVNSLLPIISIYSSVPFLSKRRHFSRLVAKPSQGSRKTRESKGKISKESNKYPNENPLLINVRGAYRVVFLFECSNPVKRYRISAARFTKASGRMGSGTDWAWRPVDAGYTGASGRKDSRVDTVSGNRPRPRRGTRERGRAVFRMDTVQRPTPTVVSSALILCVYIYAHSTCIRNAFNEERWKFFWILWRCAWAGI